MLDYLVVIADDHFAAGLTGEEIFVKENTVFQAFEPSCGDNIIGRYINSPTLQASFS